MSTCLSLAANSCSKLEREIASMVSDCSFWSKQKRNEKKACWQPAYMLQIQFYYITVYWTNDCENTLFVQQEIRTIVNFIMEGNKWLPIFETCQSVNLSMYGIKTSYPGKCLNNSIFIHSLRCINKLTHSFFYAWQLMNKSFMCTHHFACTFLGIISI